MSIEKMSAKAKELKSKGHSTREICQEMHLSQATVEWLLAKQASDNFTDNIPADVKVGWRTIGVSGTRIQAIAEIMADVILEEQENRQFELNTVAGLTNNGVPLATIISDILGNAISFGRLKSDATTNVCGLKIADLLSLSILILPLTIIFLIYPFL